MMGAICADHDHLAGTATEVRAGVRVRSLTGHFVTGSPRFHSLSDSGRSKQNALMRAQQVDPRTVRWEHDHPAYRVYFWQRITEGLHAGWASDEWRLTDTDVHGVLTWATENANGRYPTIWVELETAGQTGLVRLSGWEPTRPDVPPDWVSRSV